MNTDLFQSCGHCWVFQICWHIECRRYTEEGINKHIKSCLTLPGSSVHGSFQARVLEWGAIAFSVLTIREMQIKTIVSISIRSDQISRSVTSDSSRPHESQHTRPPCPSPTSEFTQTHVHQVSDAIQPSHPLSSPSPPAPNPSQHQSLFQWVSSSHEVAKVLEFQL